jgi:hypothetical protein
MAARWAIEYSVVTAGAKSCGDFGRLIIEPGAKWVRLLGANGANPAHAGRTIFREGAKHVRTIADPRSSLFDDVPVPVHLLAKVSRFLFDAGAPRGDSWTEIIDRETAIRANTECVGECRIGAVAPMSDTPGVSGRAGRDVMAASSRDRISVDLRGLKAALLERSQARGQSPSDFVRAALMAALQVEVRAAEPVPAMHGRRVRLSLRMHHDDARQVIEQAQAAGLPAGVYVAALCAGVPAIAHGSRPADQLAALVSSSAALSTLARDLRHLTQLLRQGEVLAAQQYRARLDDVERDVRAHLTLAAPLLSELKPLLRRVSAPSMDARSTG